MLKCLIRVIVSELRFKVKDSGEGWFKVKVSGQGIMGGLEGLVLTLRIWKLSF